MWIITRAISQYDQDGHYAYSVFIEKPLREDIRRLLYGDDYNPKTEDPNLRDVREKYISWLLKGGGRQEVEYEWFFLTEIKSGELYDTVINKTKKTWSITH